MSQETEQFRIIVKTYKGLEEILVQELEALGAADIKPLKRAVECTGDLRMLYLINLRCRTALKVLKPFYTFTAENADEVYEHVKKFEWETFLTVKSTISILSTVFSDNFTHSKFVTYRMKDGIVDWFMDKYGERPSVRVSNPDFQFNLHISGTSCTLSLDSSGESLHKRGWRKEQTEAPLSEVLAAGLIMLTGWKGDSDLYDPMCGSGTFLVEAAMIACNIAPGIYRQSFGFEKWQDFDQELFSELYDDDSQEREFKHKIYGSDVSPEAIKISQENIKSAGVSKFIELEQKAIQRKEPLENKGVLITNPPYGERLKLNDMKDLYGIIGERLKHAYAGFNAWILGYQEESFFAIGLRPSRKIEVKNGDLDCQFRLYELYEGTKKIHKLEGREERPERPKEERRKSSDRDDAKTDYEKRLAFRRKQNPDEGDRRSEFKKRRTDDSSDKKDFKRGPRFGDREERSKPGKRFDSKDSEKRERRGDRKSSEGRDRRSGTSLNKASDTNRKERRFDSDKDKRGDKSKGESGFKRERKTGFTEKRSDFRRFPKKEDSEERSGFKRTEKKEDPLGRPEFGRKGRPGESERRAEFDRRRSGGRLGGKPDPKKGRKGE